MSEYEHTNPEEHRRQVSMESLVRERMEAVGCSYDEADKYIQELIEQAQRRVDISKIELTEEDYK